MTNLFRRLLVVAFAAAGLLAASAGPAAAATPCWKTLLNDWYDGRIDHVYPVHCYEDALHHLPTDVQEYSSAHDDIERALLDARLRDRRAGRTETPGTLVPASTTPRTTTSQPRSTAESQPPLPLPGNHPRAGIERVADELNPASPDALPIPLLVLGGLAILLVAAGGLGALIRRRQDRS